MKKEGFHCTLGFAIDGVGGTPVSEFVALSKIVTDRHGKEVMVSETDREGHMHFSKNGNHLGYIDVNTGSLIWEPLEKFKFDPPI